MFSFETVKLNRKLFLYIIFANTLYRGVSGWDMQTVEVLQTRRPSYEPKVINNVCLLKPEAGPCRGRIKMYRFEPEVMNCTSFEWGGCMGNGNRFDTRSDCLATCLSAANPQKRIPRWCSLSFDYGFCFGAIDRWFYDHLWKVCKKTIYSGCGGNKNNFYTQEQCENVCRFGNGWLTLATKSKKNGIKKILIVNPLPGAGSTPPTRAGDEKAGESAGRSNGDGSTAGNPQGEQNNPANGADGKAPGNSGGPSGGPSNPGAPAAPESG